MGHNHLPANKTEAGIASITVHYGSCCFGVGWCVNKNIHVWSEMSESFCKKSDFRKIEEWV